MAISGDVQRDTNPDQYIQQLESQGRTLVASKANKVIQVHDTANVTIPIQHLVTHNEIVTDMKLVDENLLDTAS